MPYGVGVEPVSDQMQEGFGSPPAGGSSRPRHDRLLAAVSTRLRSRCQTTSKYLEQLGVSVRYRVLESDDQRDEVGALYTPGMSIAAVARKLGVDRRSIRTSGGSLCWSNAPVSFRRSHSRQRKEFT
jgi:hypothetical protein